MLLLTITFVFLLRLCYIVTAVQLPRCERYSIPGDINIGGIFSFYVNSEFPCERDLEPRGVFMAESMRFAIENINDRDDLLPNVTLGFDIVDDGWSEDIALRNTLNLVSNYGMVTGDTCVANSSSGTESSSPSLAPGIVGIIGTSRSATTIPATRLAALFDVPLISYYASSVELTDKLQFPYFLRTVPPDGLQVGAIVDLLLLYDWNYIGVIHSIDSYGIHGARQLQTLVEASGLCVAFISPVSDSATEKELKEVVSKFEEFPLAKTVVMFSSGKVANTVLEQMKREDFSRKLQWVGSDDWGYDLKQRGHEHLTTGAIFMRFYSVEVPEYEQYVRRLDYEDPSLSPWYKAYWQHRASELKCMDIQTCDNMFLEDQFSAIYITLPVIDAVNVYAQGLHSLMLDKCRGDHDNCREFAQNIEGEELLAHLRNVNFEAVSGPFRFDDNADPPGKYILRNWQVVDGEHQFVDVGLWDSSKPAAERLTLDEHKITFADGSGAVPKSVCYEECKPGHIVVPLEQKCCWGCQRCQANSIVNVSKCVECDSGYWPSHDFTTCKRIVPTDLDWAHPVVLVVVVISVLGVLLCSVTVTGMGWYGDKPIIKACSRELSAINILGIAMSFACTFTLLFPPTPSSCMVADAEISLCFALTYTPTMFKVNRIFRIFRAGKKSVKRPKMVGPRETLAMVALVILIQVSWMKIVHHVVVICLFVFFVFLFAFSLRTLFS